MTLRYGYNNSQLFAKSYYNPRLIDKIMKYDNTHIKPITKKINNSHLQIHLLHENCREISTTKWNSFKIYLLSIWNRINKKYSQIRIFYKSSCENSLQIISSYKRNIIKDQILSRERYSRVCTSLVCLRSVCFNYCCKYLPRYIQLFVDILRYLSNLSQC